ncbi:MAG TPA: hypothetical protein VFJ85_16155 [Acidimicrobiales bacterium]|nr:hypothetical protein [Acidimicrobiales bacterium]
MRTPARARLAAAAAALVLLAACTGGGTRSASSASSTTAPRSTTTTEEPGVGDMLSSLLKGLTGGGGPGITGALLNDCGSALAGAGGSAGLLPHDEPTDPGEQLRQIATSVEELRHLGFSHVPDPLYVTPQELSRRVREETVKGQDPATDAATSRALIALGALPAGSDIDALTTQALGDQVAGYYDPATGQLVVGRAAGKSGGLDGAARTVLAHELDHALTDQALHLPVDEGRVAPGTEDAALARLALIEGDATLLMQQYSLGHVALLEQLQGMGGALASQEQLDRLPHFVQRSITFPYFDGLSFACRLYAAGGWQAVDAAYRNPPTTTAQVLYPGRYQSGEKAITPRPIPTPGGSWKASPAQSLGAAELAWLLEAPGGDTGRALDDPAGRAAAWAGGTVQSFADGERTAVGVGLVQRAGERRLCDTVKAWYTAAFPDARPARAGEGEAMAVDGAVQDAVLRCPGNDVRLGIGPDLSTARALAG